MNKNSKSINILTELGSRGVYQAVGIYVAVAWGSVEILITASERFGWPTWLGDAALILFLTALPFVVLLSWAFDLSGSGLKRMEPGSLTGKVLIASTLTLVLGLSASWFTLEDNDPEGGSELRINSDGRPLIAILPFEDLRPDADQGVLVRAFTNELINRVNVHPDMIALNPQTVFRLQGLVSGGATALQVPADYTLHGVLQPAQVGTKLQAYLLDRFGQVQWEYEAVRDFSSVRQARLEQEHLAGELAAKLGFSLTGIDYCEPTENAEALQLFYAAGDLFESRGAANVAGAARMLERAIELDPGFARAQDLLGSVYQRFAMHVTKDPSQYGMNEQQLWAFIEQQPYMPLLRRALALCPNLGSACLEIELAVPVMQYQADLIDLIREALRRDPSNTPLMDWATYVFLRKGHVQSAMGMASEFYRRDPLNPRAPQLMAMVMRVKGETAKAVRFTEEVLVSRDDPSMEGLALAWDRVRIGDWSALTAGLGEEFKPSPESLPLDPRLLQQRDDPAVLAALKRQVLDSISEDDFSHVMEIQGGSPWLLTLDDRDFTWQVLERFAEVVPEGASPSDFWYKDWRHWFGNQQLVELMDRWTTEHRVFWDRHGPPDGCSWDGENLICDWAENS